jgi:hypothetical protein
MNFVEGWWPYPPIEWPGVRLRRHGDDSEFLVGAADLPWLDAENGVPFPPGDFAKFFASFLPAFADHSWLVDSGCFDLARMPEAEQQRIESFRAGSDYFLLRESGLLARWACFVADDWNRLFALPPSAPPVEQLFDEQGELSARILDAATLFFDNYDGAYWACYAREADLIDRIIAHHRGMPALEIEPCSFADTFAMHKRKWEEWESKYMIRGDDAEQ